MVVAYLFAVVFELFSIVDILYDNSKKTVVKNISETNME